MAAQVGAFVSEHGVQLTGAEPGQGAGGDHYPVAPARQAVGGGRVLVDDQDVQCLVWAARGGHERSVRAVLAPGADKPAGQVPGRLRDDGADQQRARRGGRRSAGYAVEVPGRPAAGCLPGH